MVTLSTEQFRELLSAVNRPGEKCGSFSSCSARYGGERSSAKVEEFVSSITTFKLVEKISDADAVSSMPMLLEGDASEWWQGVKSNVKTFDDVVRLLRESFSPPRPAWRIYAEINETKQQKNEPTDSFIRRKRALFAQLPSCPKECDQIDMVYGLLHAQIRERLFRHKVKTFDELLTDAREAENMLCERNTVNTDGRIASGPDSGPKRCSFCRKKGHTVEKCFKKQELVSKELSSKADPVVLKPKFACYGCNAPGVVRANCPNCSKSNNGKSPMSISFNSLGLCIGGKIPIVNVQMFGVSGQAYFDSGAKTSVAGSKLKKIMDTHGCTYESIVCSVSLADGTSCERKCLTTETKIVIGGRCLNIKFLLFPEDRNNRTLIGSDFMQEAGIVLNMGQRYWHFENCPTQRFDFSDAWPLGLNHLETTQAEGKCTIDPFPKPFEEPLHVTPKRMCRTYVSDFESYGPDYIKESDYSPHAIQDIFRDAIPPDMVTPERAKENKLFGGVVYKPFDVEAEIFTPLYAFDAEILKETDGTELTEAERQQLDKAIAKHRDVFGGIGGPTPYAVHKIDTGNHEPIALPPYRLSFAKTRELKIEIENMIGNDIIEECESAWSSPVVMVPKKDGSVRVCVDYRQLNSLTSPDRYPLPRMDDLLHLAKSTKFMTTLDLQCGYYQVEVAADDQDKTCFITPFGTYRFKRMPFGLRNAPATFQRLINRFKSGIAGVGIFAYLDDMIICSNSFQNHVEDLDIVFKRLLDFKLRLNMRKCRFCCASVKFLGHVLTPEGIAVDPDKTQAILERKVPRNVKELISFIQTCSWYRRFINQYAEISRPLTNLTKKNVLWKWGEEEQEAFDQLKVALSTSPVLKQSAENVPYSIKTDASSYALGAVLLQGEGSDEHPLEYASRLLSNAERNYSTTEREALAIVWACDKFRGYIEGEEIRLLTDHKPLKWLLTLKSPTGRLARWGLQLQQYNFKIEHVSGKANVVADMLSRPICTSQDSKTEEGDCICAFHIDMPARSITEIREEQLKDNYLKEIIMSLETNDENSAHWVNRSYLLNDGILYRYANDDCDDAQLVIPTHERSEILKTYHNDSTAGHYGVERTIARISSRCYWPGMRNDITKHVKSCIECQRFKAANVKPAGLLKTTSSTQRFEIVAIDLFGPLPQTAEGYRWIFIVEDVASRWVEIFKLQDATAEACAKTLLEEIFLRYGIPRRIKSDNGIQFVSAVMQQVTYCLGIQQQFTPVYHPEANPVERKNRDLKSQLAILVQTQHNNWHHSLAAIRFAMNTAKCQSTGYSAAYLTFGRELRTLDDVNHDVKSIIESESFIPEITTYLKTISNVLENAKEREMNMQDKNKAYVDERRRPQPNFKVGTKVLVTTHVLSNASKGITSKFVPKRDGPYVITRQIGSSTYEVSSLDDQTIPLGAYHASALTLFRDTPNEETPAPVHPMKRRGRPRKA